MIHIELDVDHLDYEALVNLLLPLAQEHVRQKPDSSLARLVGGDTAVNLAKALIKTMSQDRKDKMAADLINKNGALIKSKAEEYARQNGLGGTITNLNVTVK